MAIVGGWWLAPHVNLAARVRVTATFAEKAGLTPLRSLPSARDHSVLFLK
jgi:hypothetical protein